MAEQSGLSRDDIPYRPPSYGESAFNCPHCQAYAEQIWSLVYRVEKTSQIDTKQFKITRCSHCNNFGMWEGIRLVYPIVSSAPPPNRDIPDDIKDDYQEARSIVSLSPRGACGLLRLAIQKLCKHLGETGKDINADIASLVEKGLPVRIQQSLDIVRVVGNEAVHPGQLDLKDDEETATQLFGLVNLIVDDRISQPKDVENLFQTLPEEKRSEIQRRDKQPKKGATLKRPD